MIKHQNGTHTSCCRVRHRCSPLQGLQDVIPPYRWLFRPLLVQCIVQEIQFRHIILHILAALQKTRRMPAATQAQGRLPTYHSCPCIHHSRQAQAVMQEHNSTRISIIAHGTPNRAACEPNNETRHACDRTEQRANQHAKVAAHMHARTNHFSASSLKHCIQCQAANCSNRLNALAMDYYRPPAGSKSAKYRSLSGHYHFPALQAHSAVPGKICKGHTGPTNDGKKQSNVPRNLVTSASASWTKKRPASAHAAFAWKVSHS